MAAVARSPAPAFLLALAMPATGTASAQAASAPIAAGQPAANIAWERAAQGARRTDTIRFEPDTLVMQVGERVRLPHILPLDPAGNFVPEFVPLVMLREDSVLALRDGHLQAVRTGRTGIEVRAASDPEGDVAPRPRGRIEVVVEDAGWVGRLGGWIVGAPLVLLLGLAGLRAWHSRRRDPEAG